MLMTAVSNMRGVKCKTGSMPRSSGRSFLPTVTPPRPSVPIPKFANLCGTSDANFGIKGTLANISFLVWFLDLKFLYELAAIMEGTSDPPHWPSISGKTSQKFISASRCRPTAASAALEQRSSDLMAADQEPTRDRTGCRATFADTLSYRRESG
jgi:hypothetical protein